MLGSRDAMCILLASPPVQRVLIPLLCPCYLQSGYLVVFRLRTSQLPMVEHLCPPQQELCSTSIFAFWHPNPDPPSVLHLTSLSFLEPLHPIPLFTYNRPKNSPLTLHLKAYNAAHRISSPALSTSRPFITAIPTPSSDRKILKATHLRDPGTLHAYSSGSKWQIHI